MSELRSTHYMTFTSSLWVRCLTKLVLSIALFPIITYAQCNPITLTGNGTISSSAASSNSSALQAAVNGLAAPGGCVEIPSGLWPFDAVSLIFNTGVVSFTIEGDGPDSSILNFLGSGGGGITVTASDAIQTVHIRDLTLSTTSTDGTLTALLLNNPTGAQSGAILPSDIVHVNFRGANVITSLSGWGEYWGTGVQEEGWSNLNFDTDMFVGPANDSGLNGVGIVFDTPSTDTNSEAGGIWYNIAKCSFYAEGNGILIGANVQGITVTQSNFQGGTTGIYAESGVDSTYFTQLAVTGGNQFEVVDPGIDIAIAQPLAELLVSGNVFTIQDNNNGNNPGILLLSNQGDQTSIVNNTFRGATPSGTLGAGINVAPSNSGSICAGSGNCLGVITGNTFYGLAYGVTLSSYTTNWNVQANVYKVTTPVYNLGSGNSIGVATE